MSRKYPIVLFFLAFVGAGHTLSLQVPAFADSYTQDGQPCPPECVSDSMEIVTWYPSPYNEYEELRLYPISESNSPNAECGQDNRGLMYYDKDDDKVYICKGAILGWKELGSGGSLTQSDTSISFCDSTNLGTIVYDIAQKRPYVCAQNTSNGYVWKPLDSDYDRDGVTDAVDYNDNDLNDATAVEANVESGKTFYARGGSRKTGNMAINSFGGLCKVQDTTAASGGTATWTHCAILGGSAALCAAEGSGSGFWSSDSSGTRWVYFYLPCSCVPGYTLTEWTRVSGSYYIIEYYCKRN